MSFLILLLGKRGDASFYTVLFGLLSVFEQLPSCKAKCGGMLGYYFVWKLVVSIQVVSIRTQEVKLHKKFDHFRLSLGVNKKNICRECS